MPESLPASPSVRWEHLKSILDAALERAPEEWADFVDRACRHDAALRRLTIESNADIRLFRGFSVNINGEASWIRDNLSTPADLSDEDVRVVEEWVDTGMPEGDPAAHRRRAAALRPGRAPGGEQRQVHDGGDVVG